VISTAKRLRSLAQGCRVARLPWDRMWKRLNPNGVASNGASQTYKSINPLIRLTTVLETDTTPLGLGIVRLFYPGLPRNAATLG